jgi:hypothetical protein
MDITSSERAYDPMLDRAVKQLCNTAFSKVKKDLAFVADPEPTPTSGTTVPAPRGVKMPPRVVSVTTVDGDGVVTDQTPRQMLLEEVDQAWSVLPQLAKAHEAEAERLDLVAHNCAEEAARCRDRAAKVRALVHRYEQVIASVPELTGITNLADLLTAAGPGALGLDEEEVEIIRQAHAL